MGFDKGAVKRRELERLFSPIESSTDWKIRERKGRETRAAALQTRRELKKKRQGLI